MNFSLEQKSAFSHTFGPALVLAGPGSGKTRVIVQRLKLLQQNYPTAKTLSLTFSKAAAIEMKQRFKEICPDSSSRVHFATLHSMGYQILKKFWKHKSPYKIVDNDRIDILRDIFFSINNAQLPLTEAESLINAISRKRNLTDNTFSVISVQIKNFTEIYNAYNEYKEKHKFLDYDDMLFMAYDVLNQDHEQLSYWSNFYDFIQVDEAQDLTNLQFQMIYKISANENIFVVADDDQSIYGFRGAQPACLQEFTEHFTNCTKFYLSTNYRSSPEIVKFSTAVISKNNNRFIKNPVAATDVAGKIEILHTKDSVVLGKYIGQTIVTDNSIDSYGILYRNNYSAASLAAVLINKNVSFEISGNQFPISNDYINMFFINYIKKGLSTSRPRHVFLKMIDHGFVNECLSKKMLSGQEKDKFNTAIDFLYTVCSICASYKEVEKLIHSVKEVCISGAFNSSKSASDRIYLSTIHSSKGLEYDNVFIIDMNKGHFPGKSSYTESLLEEERRLFYVALTRAKRKLYLMYLEKYAFEKIEESIFITEARNAMKGVK